MKITLIHGNDTGSAVKRLQAILDSVKKRGWEIVRLSSDESLSFREKATSSSLFEKEILYLIENANKISPKDLEWLFKSNAGKDFNLLIFEKAIVSQRIIKLLPKGSRVEKFDLPKILFNFLDSIYPGNSKVALKLFHDLLHKEPPELVFALVGSRMKELFWTAHDPQSLHYDSWRVSKLKSQASKFQFKELSSLINSLAEIDLGSKSGGLPTTHSLDLLIASKLK